MTTSRARVGALCLCFGAALAGVLPAQFGGSRRVSDNGVGRWETDAEMPADNLTFVRLEHSGHKGGYTDYPDAERNFTARLQQLTSIEVNPVYRQMPIDDSQLFQYPFAFMTHIRGISFSSAEAEAMRRYLSNGGFVMVDDLWGDRMWDDIYDAMKDVFPDREPVELDLSHPIFNCVFKLDFIPQVPSHDAAEHWRNEGLDRHYETNVSGSREELDTPHFRAWLDDRGRIMMLVCHNNDLADGWEEESYQPWFFKKYSEKMCFPMGINIVFYALTH